MPIRRNLEYHELSGKLNLVILMDGEGFFGRRSPQNRPEWLKKFFEINLTALILIVIF